MKPYDMNTSILERAEQATGLSVMVLDSLSLVPQEWREEVHSATLDQALADGKTPEEAAAEAAAAARFRVFNPTLIDVRGGYALCYRVVADNTDVRRLATCRLTPELALVPDSVTPLSNLIEFEDAALQDVRARTWHADPRYLRLRGRLYVIWNDGANRPMNHQFILELDPQGLRPVGQAREITRQLKRDPVEKNWMLFEAQDKIWATYSIQPHEVLRVDFDARPVITSHGAFTHQWRNVYVDLYGEVRGSAQPVLTPEGFLVIAHSSYKTPEGRKYCAMFYRHEASAPFRVTAASTTPFDLPNPKGTQFEMKKLNKEVAEVVYPCGFVLTESEAVIAYGLNDEACALARVPRHAIERELCPVHNEFIQRGDMPGFDQELPADVERPSVHYPKPMLPLFWWDAQGKKFDGVLGRRNFSVGNFGDIASKEIVERVAPVRTRAPRKGERKLVSIGSVLHTAGNGDVIWGTGAKGSKLELAKGVKELSVHAVRGPLTAEFLRRSGIDISNIKAFFDPGCLIPVLYRQEIEAMLAAPTLRKGGVRIIPHYHDDLNWRRQYPAHVKNFVSVDTDPAGMISQIIGADRVISSSLHGLIFAEALGIPAIWLTPSSKEDQMKYFDYYYGSGRQRVVRCTSLEEALLAEPMPLPKFDFDAYLHSFPHAEVATLGLQSVGIAVGQAVKLGGMEAEARDEILSAANFERNDATGLWLTARAGLIRTYVRGAAEGERYSIELHVMPFNPKELPVPQQLAVRVNGGPAVTVDWAAGSRATLKVDLEIVGEGGTTPLDIEFRARNARSPRTLGLSPIGQTLAVCLSSISVRPGL